MKLNSIGLLPNFTVSELATVVELIGQNDPGSEEVELFNQGLADLLQVRANSLFMLDSARSALYLAYEAISAQTGSGSFEVLMPAFTCVVAVNPVIWAGLKPVFVEISVADFNTSVDSLLAAVTEQTKVIFCQHTFGAQIDVAKLMEKLKSLGREDIFVIEDLAHNLGDNYNAVEGVDERVGKVGTRAHFAVATFGLEKVISTLRGGALLVNRELLPAQIVVRIEQNYQKLEPLADGVVLRLLKNAKFWQNVLPKYYWGIGPLTYGKLMTYLGHKRGILGVAIETQEYSAGKPSYLPAKLPGKLAKIGNMQLKSYTNLRDHRRQLAEIYSEGISASAFGDSTEQRFIAETLQRQDQHSFLRYPLLMKSTAQRSKLLYRAKQLGFVLGDWYKTPLYTRREFLDIYGYDSQNYPISEDIMSRIVNLPTSIQTSSSDAEKLVKLIAEIDADI
jgi:dTDP-4-amino-4,6-dideoxygalactose transaminase